MKKTKRILPVLFLILLLLTGCSRSEEPLSGGFELWYLDPVEMGLSSTPVALTATDTQGQIDEVMNMLISGDGAKGGTPLLIDDVKVQSYELESQIVTIDFSRAYTMMDRTREVLARAGFVRTLVQIDGVRSVRFLVEGEALKNSSGSTIGPMNADSFVENTGRKINAYSRTEITLYFANEKGDRLRPEVRQIYYSSNKPLELAVMEYLVAGPIETDCYASVPASTQIISVSTQDRICYVNLSSDFAPAALSVTEDVTIYSIVDSIIRNCEVDQVQIAINGEINLKYGETMPLERLFEFNEGLIES